MFFLFCCSNCFDRLLYFTNEILFMGLCNVMIILFMRNKTKWTKMSCITTKVKTSKVTCASREGSDLPQYLCPVKSVFTATNMITVVFG